MRFSSEGFYIEAYVKCANCGELIYGAPATVSPDTPQFCSEWCREWSARRAAGVDEPRLPLPKR